MRMPRPGMHACIMSHNGVQAMGPTVMGLAQRSMQMAHLSVSSKIVVPSPSPASALVSSARCSKPQGSSLLQRVVLAPPSAHMAAYVNCRPLCCVGIRP